MLSIDGPVALRDRPFMGRPWQRARPSSKGDAPGSPETLMRPCFTLLFVLFASIGVSAQTRTPRTLPMAPILTTPEAHDAHSFARPDIARVTHVSLDLDADFEAHRMIGTATLDIVAAQGAAEIVLD